MPMPASQVRDDLVMGTTRPRDHRPDWNASNAANYTICGSWNASNAANYTIFWSWKASNAANYSIC